MDDQGELNPSSPRCLHLISAFFALESTDCLISLARECGGGSITDRVQSLIWEHCINKAINKDNAPSNTYVKNFLKKVIVEVESTGNDVLDGLYEQFAHYITSIKDDTSAKGNTSVCKTFSFLFPNDCVEVPTFAKSMKAEVPLQCSLNMLEGGTGCWIWPSGLYLSEFILSYPEIFTSKSCVEVGSGVGLVGICLALVKASEVILTDGDMSTLATLKLNLEKNLSAESEMSQGTSQDTNMVKCKYLSWELASESELQVYTPDIVLGADVMYDPSCFPHLVRVLSVLLKPKTSNIHRKKGSCADLPIYRAFVDNDINDDQRTSHGYCDYNSNNCGGRAVYTDESPSGAIAYVATVIRNVDTYNYFLSLASKVHLSVVDITENQKPLDLLPYMQSYDRPSIRLLTISNSPN